MTMMKLAIIASILATASAAPAIVWKQSSGRTEQHRALHSSTEVSASYLLADTLGSTVEGSTSVIFLVSKGADGSESLTELASSGKLPSTSLRYSEAEGVYHHVSDVESSNAIVRDASNTGVKAVHATLEELHNKLTLETPAEIIVSETGMISKASKEANKRARGLNTANVLVVTLDPTEDTNAMDEAIVRTIESDKVDAVILAGIRSVTEVQHERYLVAKRRADLKAKTSSKLLARNRRRLEQEEQEGDEADDMNMDADYNQAGVYFVHMTPNIFAGLLFMFLFSTIAWIGINCLGAIAGQDVYVSKAPSIGREA